MSVASQILEKLHRLSVVGSVVDIDTPLDEPYRLGLVIVMKFAIMDGRIV